MNKKASTSEAIFIGIVLALLVLLVFTVSKLLKEDIGEIGGHKCAKGSRLTVDYPFCTDMKNCVDDCFLLNGGFVKMGYRGQGFGKQQVCFCLLEDGIQNIW